MSITLEEIAQRNEVVLDEIKAVQEQYHRQAGGHEIKMRLLYPKYFGKWETPIYSDSDISLAILGMLQYGQLELTRQGLLNIVKKPKRK